MTKAIPRVLAGILSAGGLVWGIILLALALTNGWRGILGVTLYFGLGYLVWAGWIVRTFTSLRFSFRVSIWIGSVAYHSVYLLGSLKDFNGRNGELLIYWWSAALFLSLVALALERKDKPTNILRAVE